MVLESRGGPGKDNFMDSNKGPFQNSSNPMRHEPPEVTISSGSLNSRANIEKIDIDLTDLDDESADFADFTEPKLLSVIPVKPFSHHKPTSLRPDTDVYSNQLSTQHYPNSNAFSPPPPIHPVVSAPGDVSLNEILGTLQDSKWYIFRILLLMTLLAFIHIWITQPVYRADALLEVEKRAHGTGALWLIVRMNLLKKKQLLVKK